YPPGHWMTRARAESVLARPVVRQLIAQHLPGSQSDRILACLERANALAMMRYAMTTAIDQLHAPYAIQSMFALPLASTYSPAPGLLYGLVTAKGQDYASFMSRVLFLNICVLHLSAVLLVLIARKLGLNDLAAALGACLMLFAISVYSQGYSAGSMVWIVFSEFLWVWCLLQWGCKVGQLRVVSLASGLLIFFNYLIVLPYLGFLGMYLLREWRARGGGLPEAWHQTVAVLRSQTLGLLLVAVCAILFFQPGQGNRSTGARIDILHDVYYVLLNQFSWYTHAAGLEALQGGLGAVLTIGFLLLVGRRSFLQANYGRATFAMVAMGFLLAYAALTCLGILGFAPTRHMLLLAPLAFIGSTVTLDWISRRVRVADNRKAWIAVGLVCALGFVAVHIRLRDARDVTRDMVVDADVDVIGLNDGAFNLFYRHWPRETPAVWISPEMLVAGKTYLYVSQTVPWEGALKSWQVGYDVAVTVLSHRCTITETYFMAYNPKPAAYLFTRPNNLHQVKFRVERGSPQSSGSSARDR
ncbi:MAG: hypothetical protein ACOYOU_11935, partial [Kiritimatiellia bacterium]